MSRPAASPAQRHATLDLGDPRGVADLRVFLSRARAVDDGSVRLQAAGTVLAAYVRILGPRVLGEATPTVLGLRTMALARAAELDVTVSLSAVFDRLARLGASGTVLDVPPVHVLESWAAVSPPRGPWAPLGTVSADELLAAAAGGMAEVAGTVPEQPGAALVQGVRSAVWGRDLPSIPGLPLGAAFAVRVLGFAGPGDELRQFGCGPWARLSSPRGHVLCRRPALLSGS